MSVEVLVFDVPFKPIGSKDIYLYSESEKKIMEEQTFLQSSTLVSDLKKIWDDEPQDFIILLGTGVRNKRKELTQEWLDLSMDWLKIQKSGTV